MALMLVGSFSIGLYMADLPVSPLRLKLFSYHKWLGVLAFAVVALRLIWRWIHRPPALPASMPRDDRSVHAQKASRRNCANPGA